MPKRSNKKTLRSNKPKRSKRGKTASKRYRARPPHRSTTRTYLGPKTWPMTYKLQIGNHYFYQDGYATTPGHRVGMIYLPIWSMADNVMEKLGSCEIVDDHVDKRQVKLSLSWKLNQQQLEHPFFEGTMKQCFQLLKSDFNQPKLGIANLDPNIVGALDVKMMISKNRLSLRETIVRLPHDPKINLYTFDADDQNLTLFSVKNLHETRFLVGWIRPNSPMTDGYGSPT